MVETLPPLTYGKVVGRFLAAVGDTTDDTDKFPDAMPLTGTVTFTPSASMLLVASAQPVPATVGPAAIVCTLDTEGYLTYGGDRFVWLLATDDPSVNPTAYTYSVKFNLKLGDVPVAFASYSIAVASVGITDLTTVAPVGSSGGTQITQGPPGPQGDASPSVALAFSNGTLDLSTLIASTVARVSVNRNFDTLLLPTLPATTAVTLTLILTQDSTGSRTVAWPATVKFPYGVDPVLSTAAASIDVVHLMWTGIGWLGFVGGLAFA